MPYFHSNLVIGEEFKNQGGMILESTRLASEKSRLPGKRAFDGASGVAFERLCRSRHRRRQQRNSIAHA